MRPTSIFFSLAYLAAPRWLGRAGTPLVDAGAWLVALTGAAWLRFEFDFAQVDAVALARVASVTVAMVWVAGIATHMYLGRYPIGSLDEALNLARITGVVVLALFGMSLLCDKPEVPRSVPLIAAFLALGLSVAVRVAVRLHRARQVRPDGDSARRVIVYGAGSRGRELVRAMLSGAAGDALPVAVLDDDPALRHNRISGVPVRGSWRELITVARQTQAQQLIVAFVNPAPAKINAVKSLARRARLDVKTVPSLSEQLRPWTRVSDPCQLNFADVVGRQPIDLGLREAASTCLRGKRILVTGAGGSIGAALCRRVLQFEPAELLMLDRDESALHAVQLSIHAEPRLDSPGVILGDITDTDAMHGLLGDLGPDLVFHAAALKQPALLERFPEQAWRTNVLGTLNLLEAARHAGVRQFVNISTVEAANPAGVYGRSKRIAERLVADAAKRSGAAFLSVRFADVVGSRSSALATFTGQLTAGRPVTVPHPDMTRFLMTIPEAVQLVIQATAIGSPGETLVLDVGAPTRITELAEQLVAMSGYDSPIVYTGLGRGEPLHDELFGVGEQDCRPVHPSIAHVRVAPLAPGTALARCTRLGSASAMAELTEFPRIIGPRTGSPVEVARVRVGAASPAGREVEQR